MTSAPTTAVNPTASNATTAAGRAGPLCWKFTAAGQWERVPAPWPAGKSQAWFCANADRVVFTSRIATDADLGKPAVEIYDVRDSDPSAAGSVFVAVFEGMEHEGHNGRAPVDTYFLVEPPAVAKLIAEFAMILTVHPQRSDITPNRGKTKSRRPIARISVG